MNQQTRIFEWVIERDGIREIARSFTYLHVQLATGWECKYNNCMN